VDQTQNEQYKRRIQEMDRRISNLERVLKLTQVINSTLEKAPLLEIIIQAATELTNTESASIMLLDQNSGDLRFEATTAAEVKPFAVPIDGSIAGTVLKENRALLVRDARSDPRWYQNVDEASGFVTRSIMAVPMEVRGKVIGVVEAINKRSAAEMTWDDVQILVTLANQAAIAIQKAQLLAELQAAYDELNELDQMKSNFIAIAAHELRTPLSVILGYAMFLKQDVSGTAEEQLDIVLQSAMRLRSLIDDMANLREVDSGVASLDLTEFPVQDLVSSVVGEIRSIAAAKGQHISVAMPRSPIFVQADRSKMHIVLMNLLSNAVKFTGRAGRIGVRVQGTDRQTSLMVWDTGIGISEENISRIFDRFYQIEPSLARQYEGMGLGLAIAKEMVALHRGHIRVHSRVGQGSAFTVTIPIRQSMVAQEREEAQNP